MARILLFIILKDGVINRKVTKNSHMHVGDTSNLQPQFCRICGKEFMYLSPDVYIETDMYHQISRPYSSSVPNDDLWIWMCEVTNALNIIKSEILNLLKR